MYRASQYRVMRDGKSTWCVVVGCTPSQRRLGDEDGDDGAQAQAQTSRGAPTHLLLAR